MVCLFLIRVTVFSEESGGILSLNNQASQICCLVLGWIEGVVQAADVECRKAAPVARA